MTLSDQRLRSVRDALASGHQKVLSMGVFDTLLWRRVPEPSDVFWLLGLHLQSAGRLASHISPIAFAELRRAAQTNARERAFAASNSREVTLADIYGELPGTIFADSFPADQRVLVEFECERDLMVLDKEFVTLMRSAKEAGAHVILVSDTYFSSENINEFLRAAGFTGDGLADRLFVSCEVGRPKFIDLFDVVLKELDIPASDLIHVGDNPVADIHPCQSRVTAKKLASVGLGYLMSEDLRAPAKVVIYNHDEQRYVAVERL